jgi:hypothetical protein
MNSRRVPGPVEVAFVGESKNLETASGAFDSLFRQYLFRRGPTAGQSAVDDKDTQNIKPT